MESAVRRFWPHAVLGVAVTGLALMVATGGVRLCEQGLPGLCGGTYSVRIPLPSTSETAVTEAASAPETDETDDQPETTPDEAAPQPPFAAQFANLIDPQAAAEPASATQPAIAPSSPPSPGRQRPTRLQDVTFDLGAGPEAASSIEVRKTVRLNGADVGMLDVRIDESARIYANGSQLAALLPPESVRPAATADQFLSFDQLRNAGVDIRYDPTQDRLVVAGK